MVSDSTRAGFFYNVPARPVMPQRFYAVAVRLNKSKMIETSDFKTKSSTAAQGNCKDKVLEMLTRIA
jgi:hypothetical protein